MAHTLISDTMRVYLTKGGTRLSMLLGGQADRTANCSGLQDPDVSKLDLDTMLRRERQPELAGGWSAFFAATPGRCANSNAVTAEIV